MQAAVPGLPATYGVARARSPTSPPRRASSGGAWSTEAYLGFMPPLFARVRQEFGPDLPLLHDVHHRLTPIEAARLGKELEPYHLFWMEDPVPAELQDGFRLIRQHTTTPIAVGEVFNSIHDCESLIREQLVDYIRATVVHAGGITHLRKIAYLAELYHVRTGCHGATDLSPVCMGAALHFDLSVHNFGIQEYMPHTAETDKVFPHAYRFQDGDAPSRGSTRPRRRHRREARRRVPLPARVPAGEPPARRDGAQLVTPAMKAPRAVAGLCSLVLILPSCGGSGPSTPSPTPSVSPSAPITSPCSAALSSDFPVAARATAPRGKEPGALRSDKRDPRGHLWAHRAAVLEGRVRARLDLRTAAAADVGDIAVLQDDGRLLITPNPFDLAGQGVRFQPNGSGGYDVARTEASFRPNLGTRISLSDDDTSR